MHVKLQCVATNGGGGKDQHKFYEKYLEKCPMILIRDLRGKDPEASSNDKFVALELLKNANVACGMILPGCQDTGTAICMGKKGQFVWTDGDDAESISRGIYNTYTSKYLRYSQTLGTAACPPYHLAVVIGGTSAEFTLKTVKLASCKYLDHLPSTASRLATIPLKSIDEHWLQLHDAMKMAGTVSCGFAKRPAYKHWVSSGSLQLIEARRSTPSDREFDQKRRMLRKEIGQSLRKDREAWWSERANELEAAAASDNYRKLFQLIRATGIKKSGVSETICEDDGMPITSIHRRLGRWAEFF
ncbi:unnamed protein product [Schistosoma margrebowiei]|uniref:Fe-S hydro-lyase tartrate dehydratase alpha-type catalytic domain-containing protein n=1 Tax=Schistosoma margrebowiei TaxID=48269 RepID=A0A183M1U4_9TREM|nr:unnamed protein product [Schistosoma margrebowiei]